MPLSTKSKYDTLKDEIARRIHDGQWSQGMQLPTERQLMAEHGLSHATVSRALKELVNIGLIDRQIGRGTFVRQQNRTKYLAVTFDDCYQVSHPFMKPLLSELEASCKENGWRLQFFPLANHQLFDNGPFQQMIASGLIHGVIGCSSLAVSEVEQLVKYQIPFVSIYHQHQGAGVGHVSLDTSSAAATVLDHLESLGHQYIALVTGPLASERGNVPSVSDALAVSWQQELQKRNLPWLEHNIVHSDYRYRSIEYLIRGMATAPDGPTAMVFMDDNLALQAKLTIESIGRKVPQDISIVSIGDFLENNHLTNYSLAGHQYGTEAFEQIKQLSQGKAVTSRLFEGHLIVRNTCGPVSVQSTAKAR